MSVAFISPFFGPDAAGGAEAECRQTALHLARTGIDVEVLTTCGLDLQHDWNFSYHPAGVSNDEGLTVRRFPIENGDLSLFPELNSRLARGETLSPSEESQFMALHINSFPLYRYLAAEHHRYDSLFFIPYLFGTTVHGTRIAPGKSRLIPCLHDEGYARMAMVKELFTRVAGIIFHTQAERELARRLYGPLGGRDHLIGEGIDTELLSDGNRFRRKYGIDGPFILYAGRKDREKGVDRLIGNFEAYKKARPGPLRLVLVGQGAIPVPVTMQAQILDLGFVPRQDKNDAYSAAAVFCQPSLNESFSIVMMEAWLCGTPNLVHADCAVTREHVVRAGGGLYFRGPAEFRACLDYLLSETDMASRMAAAGRRYVLDHFAWNRVVASYRDLLARGSADLGSPPGERRAPPHR